MKVAEGLASDEALGQEVPKLSLELSFDVANSSIDRATLVDRDKSYTPTSCPYAQILHISSSQTLLYPTHFSLRLLLYSIFLSAFLAVAFKSRSSSLPCCSANSAGPSAPVMVLLRL
jgi:hypothetical protein